MSEKNDNKCVCGTTLRKIKTEMELFGGDVLVKNVDASWCPNCKEELMDSGQIGAAKEKVREIAPHFEAFSIRKKIAKVGNSLSVPLSKEIVEFLRLKKGEEVRITIKDRQRLIVDVA